MDQRVRAPRDYGWIGPAKPAPDILAPLRVAIIPTQDFTLMSLTCLIEFLRLAADESDFSRRVYCDWSILSEGGRALTSSGGLTILPNAGLEALESFDVIVFHGGVLHSPSPVPEGVYATIERALATDLPIVGLCTGQFLLAEMGLLDDRRCAVHFSLEPVLRKHFPRVIPITDQPVVEDGRFITCPGGLASLNLGTRLVERYCGASRAEKVLHYLMADKKMFLEAGGGADRAFIGEHCHDRRVVNAIGIMRQRMYDRCDIVDIARQVGISKRELTRLFNRHLRVPPAEYWRNIRLSAAHWMVLNTDRSVTQIAYECGFSDSSHLIRWFQRRYRRSPKELRKASMHVGIH